MTMRNHVVLGGMGLTLALGLALVPATGAIAAQQTYQYTFASQNQDKTFVDVGLCAPGAATFHLTYNEILHVSATQSGLTADEVEALAESDSSSVLVKITYTQTGALELTEAAGVVYTGHFTSWFGGNVDGRSVVFSGVFDVNLVASDGSRISGHFNSHSTVIAGREVVVFDKGATSCSA